MTASAERWREALAAWAIPDEILSRATRSPWELPVGRFAARADDAVAHPSGWSHDRAGSGLQAGGSILDVGAGAGAASLPHVARVGRHGLVTAVDSSPAMLEAFAAAADGRVQHAEVVGAWPGMAATVDVHDVVVAHHVAYNVADLEPFVIALTSHARGCVVVELPPRHPMSWANPLWEQFWDLRRPTSPTADDFVDVVRDTGVRDLVVYRWSRRDPDNTPLDERVSLVAQRLCLPVDREPEVRQALESMPPANRREVVTVAWAGRA